MKHLRFYTTLAILIFALTSIGALVSAQDVTTVVWWTEQNDSVDEFLIPLLQDAGVVNIMDIQSL